MEKGIKFVQLEDNSILNLFCMMMIHPLEGCDWKMTKWNGAKNGQTKFECFMYL